MTDGQLASILAVLSTAFAGLMGVVRWGVGRITKSIDTNTQAYKDAAKAQLESAVKFTELSTKIDAVTDWVHEHTPVDVDFEQPPTKPLGRASTGGGPRSRTNPHGFRPPARGEHND